MDLKTFDRLREVVYQKSGITLGPNKEALISARLSKRLRALGCADHAAYLDVILRDAAGTETVQLLDAISTNVTSFFREPVHFDFIKQVTSEWLRQGRRRLRFWSAACSTGEEAYSLAMTLMEIPEAQGADIRILATDISTRVLSEASEGIFDEARIEPISEAMRRRWLKPMHDGRWRIAGSLRQMIMFRRLNLSEPPFPMCGPLDIVLCRNVLIYFDARVRKGLLGEVHRLLSPGGLLMVGHAESLAGHNLGLTVVQPSIHRKL
jgi:chemotaxis protein methyltransferase CheR